MVKLCADCHNDVLKWIRDIYRSLLRLHSVYLINEPMRIFKEVVLRTDINAFGFILLLVVLQVLLFSFAKGVRAIK